MRSGPAGEPRGLWAGNAGATAVEFALVVPLLLVVLFSILTFGVVFNNYLELTNGVRAAARQFAISRGSSTPVTNAQAALSSSAPNLIVASMAPKYYVNGAACTTDAACSLLLNPSTGSVLGDPAEVTATYPCSLIIMGVNHAPSGCTLSAQTTEDIE